MKFAVTAARSLMAAAAVIVAGPALGQQVVSGKDDDAALRASIQQALGGTNRKLADLTSDVLYADVWERPGLSKRDRSLVTVSALVATNHPEELRLHIRLARRNGVTQTELIEAITHLAFYAGWPNAIEATRIVQEEFAAKSP